MFVDAHHHLWRLDAVEYPWLNATGEVRFFGDPAPIQTDYGVGEFRRDWAGLGCAGSVHVQVGAAPGQEVAETEWLERQRREHGLPTAIVAAADLSSPRLGELLDAHAAASPRVRGVRQIVSRHAAEDGPSDGEARLRDDAFQSGLQLLERRGWSFDLQLTPPLMETAAEILEGVPSLAVALCHAGSPWDQTEAGLEKWARGLERLAENPSVSCKISGLGMFDHDWTRNSVRPLVRTVLEIFGPDRAMWGSNFPVDRLYHSYERMFSAIDSLVPAENRDAVFRATATRFYRLDEASDPG